MSRHSNTPPVETSFYSCRRRTFLALYYGTVSLLQWWLLLPACHALLNSNVGSRPYFSSHFKFHDNPRFPMVAAAALVDASMVDSRDDSTTSFSRRNKDVIRSRPTTLQIITCSSSKELAHAVSMFLQPGHKVAELGSQLRAVSTAICQSLLMPQDPRHRGQAHGTTTTTSRAVLVDVTRQFPKSPTTTTTEKEDRTRARTNAMRLQSRNKVEIDKSNNRRHPDFFPSVATFYEMEQLDDWRTAFFFNPY
jgi:hypothetical protein